MLKIDISIVIVTKNRCKELCETLRRCEMLSYKNKEILVLDDGSIDGTSKKIPKAFPQVRLISHNHSMGCIYRRNQGAELAHGDIIVSLDDDSYFLDADALEQTVDIFQRHPEAGAVAFNIYDPERLPSNEDGYMPERLCRDFIGCGYAVRRSVFLGIGGFRDFYVYGNEEREFCMRLMDSGLYIVKTDAIRVFHVKTLSQRFIPTTYTFAFRNQFCSSWMNEPWLRAIPHSALIIMKGAKIAIKHGLMISYIRAFFSFMSVLPKVLQLRKPLSRRTFRLYDTLGSKEPIITSSCLNADADKLMK